MTDNLEKWVFDHYGNEFFHPGLQRIGQAVDPLKSLLQKSKIITIAGTNGKGETTHRLAGLLKNSRYCSWTSPHIKCISERFSSEDGDIALEELSILLRETHELVVRDKLQVTYYEFLFFAFCRWASSRSPLYIILEVGLGGRLDAVNTLDADLVLLTSISRDHQEFLGYRYDQILGEKLGVLRSGSKLISFLDLNYLRQRAKDHAFRMGADYQDLEEVISLPCYDFSLRNQFLAYAAYCHLTHQELDQKNWVASRDHLSFRGEIVSQNNEWWLFGSHNVDGMRKLIQFLQSANYNFRDTPFSAILTSFSKRNENDVRVMLRMLKFSKLGDVLVTAFDHPKAYAREELKKLALQEGLKFVDDISSQVHGWTHQKILVAGSYYFLGELQPLFRN